MDLCNIQGISGVKSSEEIGPGHYQPHGSVQHTWGPEYQGKKPGVLSLSWICTPCATAVQSNMNLPAFHGVQFSERL